jgi:hypothetical protein
MRSVRALDRQGQWLTAFFIAIFGLQVVALLVGVVSDRSFWAALLPCAPLWLIANVMRAPLRSLDRMPRFIAWFCIGVSGVTFFQFGKGEGFDLALTVGFGLALALAEFITAHFETRRMADQ